MRREHRKLTRPELASITSRRPVVRVLKAPANKAQRTGAQLFLGVASPATVKLVKGVPSVAVEATSEQRRVEELFSASSLSYEEQRRQRHVLDWIAYHERQVRALEATLGGLVDEHLREQDRYRQMLPTTIEGEADG